MIIYKDIFSNDEVASDTYKCSEVEDGIILEIECKSVTIKAGGDIDDALIGGNKSAEAADEDFGDETEMITGCNLVLAHRLQSTGFDKKGWTAYIKDYMKRVLKHLEENKPDRVAPFKAGAQAAVKKILGSFKDWEMFTGESMDPEGSLIYMNYREDGITPYVWMFKDGLEEEKV